MKKLQIIALAVFFNIMIHEYVQTKYEDPTKKAQRAKRRKEAAKKAAQALPNGPILTGQALIDSLNKKNNELSAQIQSFEEHNKIMKKHGMSNADKSKIKRNNKHIASNRQAIIANQTLITTTQQTLNKTIAEQATKAITDALQHNTISGLDQNLQAALSAALKASYDQGAADQASVDSQSAQTSYNQGYLDGQNSLNETSISNNTPASSSSSSSSSSQPTVAGSVCQDSSSALCDDGTEINAVICNDATTPDANGMCADGTLGLCADGENTPVCADGSLPTASAA